MPDQPSHYSIEDLLNSGIQPFPDRPAEDLDRFGRAIGRGALADPVSITADGILIDGHQRLKALAARGRKRITADDVHIIDQATKANALDWAIRLNADTRTLTGQQKAEMARRLQRERRWSQGRIAKAFGVSRPAVSQWLANYPPADGAAPTFVVGLDDKSYDVPERPVSGGIPRHPWAPDGHAYKALHKAVRALQGEPITAGLSPLQVARLDQELGDLIAAAEELQGQLQQ